MELWREKREWLCNPQNQKVMIASHRGKFASSVMENTSLAFLTAMDQGADMVEMDLAKTKDGRIVGHHDDTIERLFHRPGRIQDYTLEELRQMEIYNCLGEPCAEKLESFDEIAAPLKGKTLLVLDKCWDCWDDVYRELEQKQLIFQTVFKFYIEDEDPYRWAENHGNCMFIPMLGDTLYLDRVERLKTKAAVPALEILPEKETDEVFSPETFTRLHHAGIKVWCNSLSLSSRLVYGAGYDDLKSLRYGGNAGWGRLIERGVSIIQTDWPRELKKYLIEKGK